MSDSIRPDFALADLWSHLRQAWRRYQTAKDNWISERDDSLTNAKEIEDLETVIKELLTNLGVSYKNDRLNFRGYGKPVTTTSSPSSSPSSSPPSPPPSPPPPSSSSP